MVQISLKCQQQTLSKNSPVKLSVRLAFISFLKSFLMMIKLEFYLTTNVPYLEQLPTCLEFYRQYVAQNRPVIIRNAFNNWPALSKWNIEYFRWFLPVIFLLYMNSYWHLLLQTVLRDKGCHCNCHSKWLRWCSYKWTLCPASGEGCPDGAIFEITGEPCRKQSALHTKTEL